MVIAIVVVLALAGAFVGGVLVGRRNKQKVEAAVNEANKVVSNIQAKL